MIHEAKLFDTEMPRMVEISYKLHNPLEQMRFQGCAS
jgi:hypothetical protein